MVRSYTGRRRFRKSFGRVKEKTQIPNLIALQKSSFDSFLQCGVPSSKMENTGLVGIFNFNLVDAIFGSMSVLSRIIYTLVGISGLWGIKLIFDD